MLDLHIHTNCSDGFLSPFEVINKAKELGVDTISITDHDTVDAYSDDLFRYAKENHIFLIPGVEISTKTDTCGIHVLGYNIDIQNQELLDALSKLRNARHNYLYRVADKLEQLGYVVHTKDLDKIDTVTKAHITLDVVQNPDNHSILIREFHHIPDRGEFIETVMNEGCPAYVKKESITPKEASDIIRKANGKVVLAHPVAYTYEDYLTEDDILKLVQDMNADGIEAYYIYVDRNQQKHNDIDQWLTFANKHHLLVTIGSDFHYEDGIRPNIGLVNENIDVLDRDIIQRLN